MAVCAKKKDSPNRYLVAKGSECDDGGEIMFKGINQVRSIWLARTCVRIGICKFAKTISAVLFTPQVSECRKACKEQPGCSVFSFWRESDADNRCRWEQSAYVGRCKNIKSQEVADLYAIPQGHCFRCLLLALLHLINTAMGRHMHGAPPSATSHIWSCIQRPAGA